VSPHDYRRARRPTRRLALVLAGALALATGACETRVDPPTALMLLQGSDSTAGLVVTPATVDLRVGQFVQLSVAGPSDLLPAVFSTDDANVASVGPTGIVTGVGPGTTLITVASSTTTTARRTRVLVRVTGS
jgi:hypothetical protein